MKFNFERLNGRWFLKLYKENTQIAEIALGSLLTMDDIITLATLLSTSDNINVSVDFTYGKK